MHIVYQLVNGDEVVAEVIKERDSTILVNPMIVDVGIRDDHTVDVRLFPYTVFASRVKEFADIHILSAVPAPPELIAIHQNTINIHQAENSEKLTVPPNTVFH